MSKIPFNHVPLYNSFCSLWVVLSFPVHHVQHRINYSCYIHSSLCTMCCYFVHCSACMHHINHSVRIIGRITRAYICHVPHHPSLFTRGNLPHVESLQPAMWWHTAKSWPEARVQLLNISLLQHRPGLHNWQRLPNPTNALEYCIPSTEILAIEKERQNFVVSRKRPYP